jgi:hypothetical protein
MNRSPRILFCDDAVPVAGYGYGFPRAISILRGLVRAGATVDFLPVQERHPVSRQRLDSLHSTGARMACDPDSPAPDPATYAGKGMRYDLIWISRRRNIESLRQAGLIGCGRVPWVFDAEAVTAPREAALLRSRGQAVSAAVEEEMLAAEVAGFADAELVVCTGPRDRDYIHRYRQGSSRMMPGELELPGSVAGAEGRDGILFVNGNYLGFRSQRDVTWLVTEVLPRVRRERPLTLHLAGYGLQRLDELCTPGHCPEGLRIHGFVPDLAPLYSRARVFAIPSRVAGGIPWKGIEAMAHGLPLVVTPLIASQLAPFTELRIAGSAAAFAAELLAIHDDAETWRRMSGAGLDHVTAMAGRDAMDGFCREVIDLACRYQGE